MEKFNRDTKCPKCGYDKAEVRWIGIQLGLYQRPVCADEHIQRTCCLCGYRWPQKPLDAPIPEPEEKEGEGE